MVKFFFIGLLSAAALVAVPGLAAFAQDVGTHYTTSMHMDGAAGGFTLPLPEGDWVLVGKQRLRGKTETHEDSVPHDRYVLASHNGKVMTGLIQVEANYELWMPGFTIPSGCTRTNVLHKVVVTASKGASINCRWLVHYTLGAPDNTDTADGQLWMYARKQQINIPRTMLVSEYYRASGSKYWHVRYYFNPTLEGVPRENPRNWTSSVWHPDRAKDDPARARVVERRIAWTEEWAPRVENGFYNR